MRTLSEEVTLHGKIETISITELRASPGEVLKSVELGKTFIIERNGKAIAVISNLPGQSLTMNVDTHGNATYTL